MTKKIVFAAILLASVVARADSAPESWTVGSKVYTSKAEAIRAIIAGGKAVEVTHTRCEILTNRLNFKACPKIKGSAFDSQPFTGLKVSAQ